MFTQDQTVRLSRWTNEFPGKGNGYFALCHSLNLEVVFLETQYEEIVDLLRLGTTTTHLCNRFPNLSDQIGMVMEELCRTDLVVLVDTDDMALLEEKRKVHVLSPGLETLYLIVTDGCNLKCRYCFINNNMPKGYCPTTMTFSVAREAIDMFFLNLSRNPPSYDRLKKTIFFYGGEPFSNFELIRQITGYISSVYSKEVGAMGEKFRFSIVTNGTLINEEIAKFVGDHGNLDIAISIDGPEEVHDQMRICANGEGSFAKAIHGYELLKKVGGKSDISISSTVGEHNIDKLPLLLDLHRKHGFASINLNPLMDTACQTVSMEYMQKVSQKILEYFMLAREEGVYEDRVMRKAKSFMEKRIHAYDCQALGAQLVCAPDGQLGVCHEGVGMKNFFFGQVSKDFDFHQNPVINEWKKRTPLNMPQCFNCSALGICGGGCAYGARLRNGSIWSVDDRFCVHSLATLDWLIWDLFKRL